jgi:hypothetical protein
MRCWIRFNTLGATTPLLSEAGYLRAVCLRRLAELLPSDFGDADAWRAAHAAAQEVMQAPRKTA